MSTSVSLSHSPDERIITARTVIQGCCELRAVIGNQTHYGFAPRARGWRKESVTGQRIRNVTQCTARWDSVNLVPDLFGRVYQLPATFWLLRRRFAQPSRIFIGFCGRCHWIRSSTSSNYALCYDTTFISAVLYNMKQFINIRKNWRGFIRIAVNNVLTQKFRVSCTKEHLRICCIPNQGEISRILSP